MKALVKVGWVLLIINILAFLTCIVNEDHNFFISFIPSLLNLNFKGILLAMAKNIGFNALNIISFAIGISVYSKYNKESGLKLIRASLTLFIISLILL